MRRYRVTLNNGIVFWIDAGTISYAIELARTILNSGVSFTVKRETSDL